MTSSMSVKEEEEDEETTTFPSSALFDSKSAKQAEPPATVATAAPPAVKQVNYDVWDLVPGQPNLSGNNNPAATGASASFVNCDSSSGISSSSSNNGKGGNVAKQEDNSTNWLDQVSELMSKSDTGESVAAAPSTGLLDDPFDADWAALATRSFDKTATTKNPFVDTDKCGVTANSDVTIQKAFELQM